MNYIEDQNIAKNDIRLRKAMALIQHLKKENDQLRSLEHAPQKSKYAIVGMSCRLPGGINSPDDLWQALMQGADCMEPYGDRWSPDELKAFQNDERLQKISKIGGFVKDHQGFDAEFFGISPLEAQAMDPQQRLSLELAWEALQHSGIDPLSLKGSQTGVFMGAMASDYMDPLGNDFEKLNGYFGTGNMISVISGRISYTLGLIGPSMTIDTACSSSLVALDAAIKSLATGECLSALVGGVTIMNSPSKMIEFAKIGASSAKGRSRSFAKDADGAGWSEGCAMVMVMPLEMAKKKGHHIHAVICGLAVNQDGKSQGLSAPNGPAQVRLIQKALKTSNLKPQDIQLIEAHGTGTPLGDAIEYNALKEVFKNNKEVYLGSVKSNLGHTQAAAGLIGVIKSALCLSNRFMPQSLHCETPRISPSHGQNIHLLNKGRPWVAAEQIRRVGVSSFGISGTNSHVILEEAQNTSSPLQKCLEQSIAPHPYPVLISAKTQTALKAQVSGFKHWLKNNPHPSLAQISNHTLNHMPQLQHRAGFLAQDHNELCALVDRYLAAPHDSKQSPVAMRSVEGGSVFVFPGQGGQWIGMGRELMQEPIFAKTINEADAYLKRELNWSIKDYLNTQNPNESQKEGFSGADKIQPALFAISLGLASLWEFFGAKPKAVLGHSQGEIAAAVFAGALSLEEGARIIAIRSRAVAHLKGTGSMLFVGATTSELSPFLSDDLNIAGYNAKESLVVAGPSESIESLKSKLDLNNIFNRMVPVDYASHCHLIDPILEPLKKSLGRVTSAKPNLTIYSPTLNKIHTGPFDTDYWLKNLRNPVHFSENVERALEDGCDHFIEMSSHPTLLSAIESHFTDHGAVVGSLKRQEGSLEKLRFHAMTAICQGHKTLLRSFEEFSKIQPLRNPIIYKFQHKDYHFLQTLDSSQNAGEAFSTASYELVEAWISKKIKSLLGLANDYKMDPNRSFIEYGMDSILGLRLKNTISSASGFAFSPNLVFRYPTVKKLSGYIYSKAKNTTDTKDYAESLPSPSSAKQFPTSSQQQRMWFLEKRDSSACNYNMIFNLSITAGFDKAIFQQSISELIQAFAILRTRFMMSKGQLIQEVVTKLEPQIEYADGKVDSKTFAVFASKPFALDKGSVFRCLVEQDRCDHSASITFCLHHIAIDGWSAAILFQHLHQIYKTLKTGAKFEIAKSHSYGDYALFENQKAYKKEIEYFESELQDAKPLNFDSIGKPQLEFKTNHRLLDKIDGGVFQDFNHYVKDLGCTSFTALMALYGLSLQKLTGQEAFPIATILANRSRQEWESVVGLFANTLPLIFDNRNKQNFTETLQQVEEKLNTLLKYQGTPLNEVLQKHPHNSLVHPFMRAGFVFENIPMQMAKDSSWKKDFKHGYFGNTEGSQKFHIGLYILPDKSSYQIELEFNPQKISPLAAKQFLQNFKQFVEAFSKRKELKTPQCLGLLGSELDWLRKHSRAKSEPLKADESVLASIWQRVRENPKAPSLRTSNASMTYEDLWLRAQQIAEGINSTLGGASAKQETIAILLKRSCDLPATMLATLMTNNIFLPIDASLPQERIATFLEQSKASLVVTTAETQHLAGEKKSICLHQGLASFQKAMGPLTLPKANDSAYLLFTSGSTGMPKGVEISHNNLNNFCLAMTELFELSPEEDRWLAVTTQSFDISLLELIWTLTRGIEVIIETGPVHHWGKDLPAKPNHLQCTPSLLKILLASDHGKELLKGLKRLLIGGESLDSSLLRSLKNHTQAEIFNMYGPTETTIWSCAQKLAFNTPISIGKPIRNTQVSIMNSEGKLVAPGNIGEICIGGHGVFKGYLNDLEKTQKSLYADPYNHQEAKLYRTGDLGYIGSAGELYCLGRIDQQVKIRGHRVELGEIENVARKIADVDDAIAFYSKKGEEFALDLYLVNGKQLANEEWIKKLSEKLPQYMLPSRIYHLEQTPRTPNGKIDKNALIKLRTEKNKPTKAKTVDDCTIIDAVHDIFSSVLEEDHLNHHKGFFDLGCSSLTLVAAHDKLNKHFNLDIPLSLLFEFPTIHKLAAQLHALQNVQENPSSAKGEQEQANNDDIAIVGMSVRLPEIDNLEEFWQLLINGKESLQRFSDAELLENGLNPEVVKQNNFVKTKGIIPRADQFDADFFGMTAAECKITDPQHLIFLECVYSALEHAGVKIADNKDKISLYAGAGAATLKPADPQDQFETYQKMIGGLNDFLCTRVSHKLNLQGPSLSVQTACSTSLVAVHLACQSLLQQDADLALAGGVSVSYPSKSGYLHEPGMITSPKGHCRPFSQDRNGTVPSQGCGVVVLKKLNKALADKDRIFAVIKGTAINNDGIDKLSFTAPSVKGQKDVIELALAKAKLKLEQIDYVETHGTATSIGDTVEISGLLQTYGSVHRTKPCLLGAVKGNIGHTDTASGVVGLIKSALSLHHRVWPPMVDFTTMDPALTKEQNTLSIKDTCEPIPQDRPVYSAVSSFGLGGTNAHAVLESAPFEQGGPLKSGTKRILPLLLSAKSQRSLNAQIEGLRRDLKLIPGAQLKNMAYTSCYKRSVHPLKQTFFFQTKADLENQLQQSLQTDANNEPIHCKLENPPLVFVFPGQGGQWQGMAVDLIEKNTVFKTFLQECDAIYSEMLGWSVMDKLSEISQMEKEKATSILQSTEIIQPLLMSVNLSLCKTLIHYGLKPDAVIGISQGEVIAAHIAGYLSLQDACKITATRSLAIAKLSGQGYGMSLIQGEQDAVQSFLNEEAKAYNIGVSYSPDTVVFAESSKNLQEIEAKARKRDFYARRIKVDYASHSPQIEQIKEELSSGLEGISVATGSIPMISTATGGWVGDKEELGPDYWYKNLRNKVEFSSSIEKASKRFPQGVYIEVNQHPTLANILENSFSKLSYVHILERGDGGCLQLFNKLGQLDRSRPFLNLKEFFANQTHSISSYPRYHFACQANPGAGELMNPSTHQENKETTFEPASKNKEYLVLQTVGNLIGVPPQSIPREESLLKLGVDSLMILRLQKELTKKTNLKVSKSDIFSHMTVAKLVRFLENKDIQNSTVESAYDSHIEIIDSPKNPRAQILFIPGMGGGLSGFQKWLSTTGKNIQLCALKLPGRESRQGCGLEQTIPELVDNAVKSDLLRKDLPLFVLGHSQGSWIAYEIVKSLEATQRNPQLTYLVSASGLPPGFKGCRELNEFAKITDIWKSASLDELKERFYGVLPAFILKDQEMFLDYLKICEIDLKLGESYLKWLDAKPNPSLRSPIIAIMGDNDPLIPFPPIAKCWSKKTSGDFFLQTIHGDHSAVLEQAQEARSYLESFL